jgi:serine/threonine-protein kinase
MGVSTEGHTEARIGAYALGEMIGRGGMGVVYRATHVHLRREVALKLLAPELSGNAEFRRRFLRESQLAASLDHPNIITVYDAGDHNGTLYIAMRYVDGVNLAELLRKQGQLDPAASLSLLDQVAAALDAAHERGLIHRDVKPANIMIASGRCYLTDFGLTKQASTTGGSSLTKTGALLGTLQYVAPEQIEGRQVTAGTDVYALGCVLYECLTGAPPFTRESEVALLYAHLNDPPPRATELRPELSAGIDDVVAKALAKSAEERYRRCGELLAAAGAVLAAKAPITPAEPPTVAAEAPTVAAEAPTVAAEPPTAAAEPPGVTLPGRTEPAVTVRRKTYWPRLLALVAGVLAVAAAAVVLTIALTGGRSRTLKQDVASLNGTVQLFIAGKHLSHAEHKYAAAAQNRRQVLKRLDAFHAPPQLRAAAQILRQMTSYSLSYNELIAHGQTAAARAPDDAHNALRPQFVAEFNPFALRYLGITYKADDL